MIHKLTDTIEPQRSSKFIEAFIKTHVNYKIILKMIYDLNLDIEMGH